MRDKRGKKEADIRGKVSLTERQAGSEKKHHGNMRQVCVDVCERERETGANVSGQYVTQEKITHRKVRSKIQDYYPGLYLTLNFSFFLVECFLRGWQLKDLYMLQDLCL